MQGNCQFGDSCIYAHGIDDLASIIILYLEPKRDKDDNESSIIPILPITSKLDDLNLPKCDKKNTKFFILKAYNKDNFLLSIRDSTWKIPKDIKNVKNIIDAFEEQKTIYFFCSIMGAKAYLGVAKLTSLPIIVENDLYQFDLEWLRQTKAPFTSCSFIGNKLKPIIKSDDLEEIEYTPAFGLLEVIYRHEEFHISGDASGEWSFNNKIEKSEDINFPLPPGIPLIDKEGYIFMIPGQNIFECLENLICGVSERNKDLISFVTPGTIIYLYETGSLKLYGPYEALTYPIRNVEPSIIIIL